MKIAIIGSRNLVIDDFSQYLPNNITELVSGGAKGIDQCVKQYALTNSIKITEFLPEYNKYRRNLKGNFGILSLHKLYLKRF